VVGLQASSCPIDPNVVFVGVFGGHASDPTLEGGDQPL
jgi:hypothetical protein